MTRICGIVGYPLHAAQAPATMNAVAARLEVDVAFIPVEIADDGLDNLLRTARGWNNLAGFIVTMPYKVPVLSLIDSFTRRAAVAGNVNVVRRTSDGNLVGDQLDGTAMVRCLLVRGIPLRGARIVVLGAGAVGRSISFALAGESPAAISIVNRSELRAVKLVEELKAFDPAVSTMVGTMSDVTNADILINATSVGSPINPGIPVESEMLPRHAAVADVVTSPNPTQLLKSAAGSGCEIVTGMDMQRAQIMDILSFLG